MIREALQVAFAHLFFNITGILIFYPIPFMRRVPPAIAIKLGNTVAQYRWFAAIYLIAVFLILPTFVFLLSLAGWFVFLAISVPLLLFGIFLAFLQCAQNYCLTKLPVKLQTFDWMPV